MTKELEIENEDHILDIVAQAQSSLDAFNAQWQEYQKAIEVIKQAVKFNVYMNDERSPKQLEKLALEVRDKTGINVIEILRSIEGLVRKGYELEDIKKNIRAEN